MVVGWVAGVGASSNTPLGKRQGKGGENGEENTEGGGKRKKKDEEKMREKDKSLLRTRYTYQCSYLQAVVVDASDDLGPLDIWGWPTWCLGNAGLGSMGHASRAGAGHMVGS